MRFLAPILALLALAATAPAAVQLSAEVGWDGHYRPGRWTPVYVTAAADPPRNAVLTVSAPHSGAFGMIVRRGIGLARQPGTYPIFLPLGAAENELEITLSDAQSGRRIASWPDRSNGPPPSLSAFTNYAGPLIGTSGAFGPVRSVAFEQTPQSPTLAPLPPDLLPTAAVAYESLDLLILDRPDFSTLSLDQQQAMADWVRAGGRLLVWPGTDPVPASGPLVDLLPLRYGSNQPLELDAKTVADAGLPARFGKIPGRETSVMGGARQVPLFGGAAPMAVRSVGYGMVGALPFDASSLLFEDEKKSTAFWMPVLGEFVTIKPPTDAPNYNYGYGDPRRASAQSAVADLLGDVPGAGEFGFGYVVAVLAGLMVVVGPLDWLVLKRLGRQPWTWATTTGWILLVTLGAVYAGRVFKSGDLHYRTLRVIDEIGGRRVAAVDVVGLYSPRTQAYGLEAQADSWWQPLDTEQYGYGRGGASRTDIGFAEDSRGCRPRPMTVNVWNLRFLRGERSADEPAVIDADLRMVGTGKSRRIVGTITNRGGEALGGQVVYVRDARATLDAAIAPGQTAKVDAPLLGADQIGAANVSGANQYQPFAPAPIQSDAADPNAVQPPLIATHAAQLQAPGPAGAGPPLLTVACDIADGRSGRIEAMLAADDPVAVVFAVADTPAPAELSVPGGIERHRTIYRAVVRLGEGTAK